MDFPDLSGVQSFLNDPNNMGAIGMLGSTQPVGPAYMQAQQQAAAQRQAALQLQVGQMQYQQAQARQNFNPQQYMIQPGQTPPQGAIGNVDMQGLLTGALKAGMQPEEAAQMQQFMDPRTAIAMKLMGQPALVVPPGGQLVAPGQAQIAAMNGGAGGGSGANPPGVLSTNTNPPADSPAMQLQYATKMRDSQPPGSAGYQAYDALVNKINGSWEQGNPQDVEQTAQAIAHGKMAPLAGNAMRSPISQKVMARVTQINPDYNAHDWAMNDEAYKDFATGKQGDQVRSLNVAVNHLSTLGTLADALNNGDTQKFNEAANLYKTQTGSPAPTNFNAAKQIVGDEVVKAVVGSGGSVSDRENAQKVIDAANSPAQLKGAISTYQQLLGGQLQGLAKQYQSSTGRNDFQERFIASNTARATGTESKPGAQAGGYSVDDIDAVLKARGALK